MRILHLCFICLCTAPHFVHIESAFNQAQEIDYLNRFQQIDDASYSAVDDPTSSVPDDLLTQCKGDSDTPSVEVYVTATSGTISSSSVANQCGDNTICIIPSGIVIEMNHSLNVGALIVRGSLEWNVATTGNTNGVAQTIYLCAGYVAVEDNGSFVMDVQQPGQSAWIYIKGNGALHPSLRTRGFGGVANQNSNDNPIIDIQGRKLTRTWSLLSTPLLQGETTMRLMHNPTLMGWIVGDRIAIAPTEVRSTGSGQEFRISAISNSGIVTLSNAAQYNFDAEFYPPSNLGGEPMLKSAEVVNLDRSIVITGDDFSQVACDNSLPDTSAGEQISWRGCRCASFRQTCTYGLHTAQFYGGVMQIKDTRVEKCGQRGVAGKYCLHFHKLKECPDCLFENNAIENSHQRGIIVHGTHLSNVEGNTLYNVRGAGVYLEDGNEMYNYIKYNINICPFPFDDNTLHGCTIPGTDNRIADTSDNQSGFYFTAATNDLIGNRAANSFNGQLLFGGNIGRGTSYGKVCGSDARIGRTEGNVFHGHGRFGTYSLGGNYPKVTDQAVTTNGHNIDQTLCTGFDNAGNTRGLPATFKNHLDYHNAFVGHYSAGDIQYNGHNSHHNLNLIYWKETKNFENGCSAHITDGSYSNGNMALPDMGTFIIENTTFGDGVSLEPNHHCNVGITGVLCMPQYVLHNVYWKNFNQGMRWITFQDFNTQGHTANQHHGGIFTLSPPDAEIVMGGNDLPASLFPPGYVSLVSSKFTYLLGAPDGLCVLSSSLEGNYGLNYDDGILCKVPLRSLKVYTRNLVQGSVPDLKVEVWFNNDGLAGQDSSSNNAWQYIGFHQIGGDNETVKQGYSLPVMPGNDKSYRLSLTGSNPNIPHDWVIEFSDVVIGNRWVDEHIYLALEGRTCGNNGLISSRHDRRFLWSGDKFIDDGAWGNNGACVTTGSQPEDMPIIDCAVDENDGYLESTDCPDLCQSTCGNNSYCDCGTLTCNCKAGFTGDNCSIDLCAAARCGSTGTCSARYLGFTLPVTSEKACICDDGFSGNSCDLSPCVDVNCSGHGTCIANGSIGTCECNPGYSGDECESSCDGICSGSYPYGCATNLLNIVKYGCLPGGGCNYLASGQEYPYDGFCTYQDNESSIPCECISENDCESVESCLADGSCPNSVELPDGAICNSIPWGICKAGICTATSSPPTPLSSPTVSPSATTQTLSPTTPTTSLPSFLRVPTDTPVVAPSHSDFLCGCKDCIGDVLDTQVGNPAYSCGDRIIFLQSAEGGTYSEYGACMKVAGEEFPDECGPMCDPDRCNATSFPTTSPSTAPSLLPTDPPVPNPTPLSNPTLAPQLPPSCKRKELFLEVTIQADKKGKQTSYEVKKRNKRGKFAKRMIGKKKFRKYQLFTTSKCLKKNKCYQFMIKDKGGNGICCKYGDGYYTLIVDGSEVKYSIFEGVAKESYIFGNC